MGRAFLFLLSGSWQPLISSFPGPSPQSWMGALGRWNNRWMAPKAVSFSPCLNPGSNLANRAARCALFTPTHERATVHAHREDLLAVGPASLSRSVSYAGTEISSRWLYQRLHNKHVYHGHGLYCLQSPRMRRCRSAKQPCVWGQRFIGCLPRLVSTGGLGRGLDLSTASRRLTSTFHA